MSFFDTVKQIVISNGLVMSFLMVGIVMWFSYWFSKTILKGRIHGSAIAIILGLLLAYVGGMLSAQEVNGVMQYKKKGLADLSFFSGIGLMGGSMLRDFAIISTAYGAKLSEIKKAGLAGITALVVGLSLSFIVGAVIAYGFGYTSAEEVATIGAGAMTFIVGPVTGTALKVSSEVIAMSIAAGVIKSILVMVLTPLFAKKIGLTSPAAAMVYGGLMGTTSGTAAGLAATNPKLVPYGAVVATFFTGFGCLLGPSVFYFITKAILG